MMIRGYYHWHPKSPVPGDAQVGAQRQSENVEWQAIWGS